MDSCELDQWRGPYNGDYVVLVLIHERWNNGFNDWDILDGNQWSSWDSNLDGVLIAAGRANDPSGTLPFNNANSNIIGAYFAIGFGLAQ